MGKTSLAMNIVENIAFSHKYINNPKNTLVFSLEMSASSLAMRLICGKAKVNMNDLRKGFVAKNYDEFAYYTLEIFNDINLWKSLRNNLIKLRGSKKWDIVAVNLLNQL